LNSKFSNSFDVVFCGLILISNIAIADDAPFIARTEVKDVERALNALPRWQEKEAQNLSAPSFSWLTGSSAKNDVTAVGKVGRFFGFVAVRRDPGHGSSRGMMYGNPDLVKIENEQGLE
jgi:hypothetical protein